MTDSQPTTVAAPPGGAAADVPAADETAADETDAELLPGDVYFDPDGLMVFSEQYLRRRGFCCKNGCRHCPWGYRRAPAETELATSPTSEGMP